MLYTEKLTAQVLITFLERLIAKRTRKLMWIVDRHPVPGLINSRSAKSEERR